MKPVTGDAHLKKPDAVSLALKLGLAPLTDQACKTSGSDKTKLKNDCTFVPHCFGIACMPYSIFSTRDRRLAHDRAVERLVTTGAQTQDLEIHLNLKREKLCLQRNKK